MKIFFNLSVDDWFAFQQYYKGKKTPFYNMVYPLIIALGVVLIAINTYYIYENGVSNITLFSLLILGCLLYVLYLRKKSFREIRKTGLNIQQKNPEAFGQMTMDFEKTGITIQSGQTSKSLSWAEMLKFEENKRYFFLYSKKGVAYIIPKHGIENLSSFRGMLINYFSNE